MNWLLVHMYINRDVKCHIELCGCISASVQCLYYILVCWHMCVLFDPMYVYYVFVFVCVCMCVCVRGGGWH